MIAAHFAGKSNAQTRSTPKTPKYPYQRSRIRPNTSG